MTEPLADKIGVVNLGTVNQQTNNVTIIEGEKTQLVYSSPLPNRSLFQGRKTELAELADWLQDGTTVLIGIRGEGGIGKSTLAAKIFDECLGFTGKCWIDVRTGTSMIEVAERALQEFGMPPAQMQTIEKKDLPQRLLRQLQSGRFLLGIDNLESLLNQQGNWQDGYEEFLDSFIDLGNGSVILLASREYPPKYFRWLRSHWLFLEEGLSPTEGAALLKALEVEGTNEERARISEIVDGNPLALSLLAGWLRQEFRPGDRTVLHLEQQGDLFGIEGKHRGEKQVSLQNIFDWSFARLAKDTQFLLSQVSVLRRSFNREAVSTLVQRTVEDKELHDLERRSLLQELPISEKDSLRRYRLQPRIQDFAQKKVGDLTIAHQQAIYYYWEHRRVEFQPNDDLEAASEYLETFYHQFTLCQYQEAIETIFSCHEFLSRRGYYQLLINSYQLLHDNWQPILEQYNEQYNKYTILCLISGNAHNSVGQYQKAIDYYEQSLTITRKIGYRHGESPPLSKLGNAYHSLGQYQKAIDYLEQSLTIEQEIGNSYGIASSFLGLGTVYSSLGQYQIAIDYYEQSLTIQQKIGDCDGEADSLIGLGNAYYSLRQYQIAIYYGEQSLTITQEIGYRHGEAISLDNLGNVYNSLGQYQIAIRYYEQSLTIQQEIGVRHDETNSLIGLGNAYYSLGQYQIAIRYYEQLLTITREIGDHANEANSLYNKGLCLKSLNRQEVALQYIQQALNIYININLEHGIQDCKTQIAQLYRKLAQDNSSAFLPNMARTLNNLAVLHSTKNELALALSEYQEALQIYRILAQDNPSTFNPYVAETLLNLSIFYLESQPDKDKSIATATETIEIALQFPNIPTVQNYAATATQVLQSHGLNSNKIVQNKVSKHMLIFEEYFQDNSHGWNIANSENHTTFLNENCYIFTNKVQGYYLSWNKITENPSFYNQTEFRIHLVMEKVYGVEDGCYGFVWGLLDVENFCEFVISNNGYYRISKFDKNEFRPKIAWTFSTSIRYPNSINVLEIQRRNEILEFYINSTLVITLPFDSQVAGQNFGFVIYNQITIKVHSLIISTSNLQKQTSHSNSFNSNIKASFVEIEPPINDSLELVYAELQSLIGHKHIKQQLFSLSNFLRVQTERQQRGLKSVLTSLHIVISGPPGTGKTTIARLIGRIYKQLGYLQRGHIVETDRAGLVAGYIGQTSLRVDDAIQQALDGVLFIDEAYALATQQGSAYDYGSEAIQTVVKRMEDYRDQLAIIVAGYPDEMRYFLKSNCGLESRFSYFFQLEHYTPNEMLLIFNKFCIDSEFILDNSASIALLTIFEAAFSNKNKSFGNGRFVRSLFEKIIAEQANRIVHLLGRTNDSLICSITAEDIMLSQQNSAISNYGDI